MGSTPESPEWKDLSTKSKSERTRNLNVIEGAWGNLAVSGLEARHVLELRDRHAATPAAANNIVRFPVLNAFMVHSAGLAGPQSMRAR